MRDGDLWDALRRQEPEALGELFGRHAAAVHAYAVRHTGSCAYADDAVQAAALPSPASQHGPVQADVRALDKAGNVVYSETFNDK